MRDKYQNKYRIHSRRLKGWNYAGEGGYFITLMVQNFRCVFGKIENNEMVPNEWGKIVQIEWKKSFEIRKELKCVEFVLMPNHLHAIVQLVLEEKQGLDNVETHGRASLPRNEKQPTKTGIAHRKPKSISSFIAGFKSSVTTKINNCIDSKENLLFHPVGKFNRSQKLWQANYHDHIIRNEQEFYKIRNYIRNNPKNWNSDGYNME